jgi:RNA polymerase sigma-70 factor, ECF subfamily
LTRFPPGSRKIVERLPQGWVVGDLDGLLAVLAPDAWGEVALGPSDPRAPGVARGAKRVARNLLHYWGPHATLVSHPVGGEPALLAFVDRVLAGVLIFTMRGELIQAVHVIGDPRVLSFVSTQLA